MVCVWQETAWGASAWPEPGTTSQPEIVQNCRCERETPSRSYQRKATMAGGRERCTAGWGTNTTTHTHTHTQQDVCFTEGGSDLHDCRPCRWASFQPTTWTRTTPNTADVMWLHWNEESYTGVCVCVCSICSPVSFSDVNKRCFYPPDVKSG